MRRPGAPRTRLAHTRLACYRRQLSRFFPHVVSRDVLAHATHGASCSKEKKVAPLRRSVGEGRLFLDADVTRGTSIARERCVCPRDGKGARDFAKRGAPAARREAKKEGEGAPGPTRGQDASSGRKSRSFGAQLSCFLVSFWGTPCRVCVDVNKGVGASLFVGTGSSWKWRSCGAKERSFSSFTPGGTLSGVCLRPKGVCSQGTVLNHWRESHC